MQLKASTDYALRAVIYLAMDGGVVSSKKIAEDIAVPRDYLIQLSQLLRNAGIIEARAGKNGGYVLAKDPAEISFLDVASAIEESVRTPKDELQAKFALKDDQSAVIQGLRAALELASNSFDAYLDSISIATLAKCAKDAEHAGNHLHQGLIGDGERLERVVIAHDGFYPRKATVAKIHVYRSGKPQELHGEQDDGQNGHRANQRPHENLAHAL